MLAKLWTRIRSGKTESESELWLGFGLASFFWRGWTIWIWFHNNTLDYAGLGSSWIQRSFVLFFIFIFFSLTIWFVCWTESEMHWLDASRRGSSQLVERGSGRGRGTNYRFITIQTVRLSSRPLAASFAAIIMQFAAACCWGSHCIRLFPFRFRFPFRFTAAFFSMIIFSCCL